jgi:hypothetical protein
MLSALGVVRTGAGLRIKQSAMHASGDNLAAILVLEANETAKPTAIA